MVRNFFFAFHGLEAASGEVNLPSKSNHKPLVVEENMLGSKGRSDDLINCLEGISFHTVTFCFIVVVPRLLTAEVLGGRIFSERTFCSLKGFTY